MVEMVFWRFEALQSTINNGPIDINFDMNSNIAKSARIIPVQCQSHLLQYDSLL